MQPSRKSSTSNNSIGGPVAVTQAGAQLPRRSTQYCCTGKSNRSAFLAGLVQRGLNETLADVQGTGQGRIASRNPSTTHLGQSVRATLHAPAALGLGQSGCGLEGRRVLQLPSTDSVRPTREATTSAGAELERSKQQQQHHASPSATNLLLSSGSPLDAQRESFDVSRGPAPRTTRHSANTEWGHVTVVALKGDPTSSFYANAEQRFDRTHANPPSHRSMKRGVRYKNGESLTSR